MDEKTWWDQNGKKAINEMLWVAAPPSMTLADAERLAVQIHSLLDAAWRNACPELKP